MKAYTPKKLEWKLTVTKFEDFFYQAYPWSRLYEITCQGCGNICLDIDLDEGIPMKRRYYKFLLDAKKAAQEDYDQWYISNGDEVEITEDTEPVIGRDWQAEAQLLRKQNEMLKSMIKKQWRNYTELLNSDLTQALESALWALSTIDRLTYEERTDFSKKIHDITHGFGKTKQYKAGEKIEKGSLVYTKENK